jgi:hypothetical protein
MMITFGRPEPAAPDGSAAAEKTHEAVQSTISNTLISLLPSTQILEKHSRTSNLVEPAEP